MAGQEVPNEDDFQALLGTKSTPEKVELADLDTFLSGAADLSGKDSNGISACQSVDLIAPDIVVFGAQELVSLHVGNLVAKANGDFDREDEVDSRIRRCLRKYGRYQKVRSVGMVGLYMACFIREQLVEHVSEEDADRVRSSSETLAGKKGGLTLRFCLGQTSFCFCNVHLPSGFYSAAERNSTLEQVFAEAFQSMNSQGGCRPSKLGFSRKSAGSIAQHDCSVVLGDFNFRVPCELSELPPFFATLSDEILLKLKEKDPGCKSKLLLGTFEEGPVDFPPTFKYIIGSRAMNHTRVPSWTDRIFYKADISRLLHYGAHMDILASDHRPVSALLQVDLRKGAVETATAQASVEGTLATASVVSHSANETTEGAVARGTANMAASAANSDQKLNSRLMLAESEPLDAEQITPRSFDGDGEDLSTSHT